MPEIFLTLLYSDDENKTNVLTLVEKVALDEYVLNESSTSISGSNLKLKWSSIVILIDDKIDSNAIIKKNNDFLIISLLFLSISVLFFILLSNKNVIYKLFILTSILGVSLSMITQKNIFNINNKIVNNFCNITNSSSCEDIINSSKWKLFNIIKFSDLSLIFFIAQFFLNLIFLGFSENIGYIFLQKWISFLSLPIVLSSIYYQKFVEKKWCPLCLSISLVLLFQFFILYKIRQEFNIKSFILYLIIIIFISLIWFYVKNQILNLKELINNQFQLLRFKRNYNLFKTYINSHSKVQTPNNTILLGNPNSEIVLTLISNPFCGHCQEAHRIIERILKKRSDKLCVKIIFKTNFKFEKEENKIIFRNLLYIYFNNGQKDFRNAIDQWYKIKNAKLWLDSYPFIESKDYSQIDFLLNQWNDFCHENNLYFTPNFFINDLEFPKIYSRSDLEFFIDDIIEDEKF